VQLRHLRYFVSIVEAGSFSRAAATIRVAQPALSQQLAELEREIGVALLVRGARGVRPTAAGDVLYREAVAILGRVGQLRGIVRSSGGEVEGVVNLGITSLLAASLSGPFIAACRAALPKVALRLATGDSLQLRSRVEARTLDIGLVFEDDPAPGFARRPLFRQCLYLIRRGPLASNGPASLSVRDLASVPLVLPTPSNVTRIKLDRAFAAAGVVPKVAAEADLVSGILSAVQADIGDTIMPKGDLSEFQGCDDLTPIPIEPAIHLTAAVVAADDALLTRAGEAVRDLLSSFVESRLFGARGPGAEWIGAKDP